MTFLKLSCATLGGETLDNDPQPTSIEFVYQTLDVITTGKINPHKKKNRKKG